MVVESFYQWSDLNSVHGFLQALLVEQLMTYEMEIFYKLTDSASYIFMHSLKWTLHI